MNRMILRLRNAAPLLSRPSASTAPLQPCKTPLRRLGGGHAHSHGGHGNSVVKAEPYAVKHHDPYPNEAYLFGIKPGDKAEGWELITYGTYLACAAILVIGLNAKEDDTFKEWARREALAREKVRENGGEVTFGTYYQKVRYEVEEIDQTPKVAENE